jgi:hypothetical protein
LVGAFPLALAGGAAAATAGVAGFAGVLTAVGGGALVPAFGGAAFGVAAAGGY